MVVIGAILTAVAGAAVAQQDGVHYSRTELIFLAPTSDDRPNAIGTQSDSITMTAGAVARAVVGPARLPKYASPEVTLVGLGVDEGWSLRLPDTGGQWATNFATQRLVLEVAAPTAEAVAAQQEELVREVAATLESLQARYGVAPASRITVIESPEAPVIQHVTGSRVRALAMTAALGIGLTLACVQVLDRRRRAAAVAPLPARRAPRHAARAPRPLR
ncbi:hypothetical protein [Agrococcus carbonis]|uniref:hypothetical protein n=1 Tax=Agrococcus carbonis TaxID=684552 RepID=UPI0018D2A23D|nr:hypothetical protein [Agrococcus carbonis]